MVRLEMLREMPNAGTGSMPCAAFEPGAIHVTSELIVEAARAMNSALGS